MARKPATKPEAAPPKKGETVRAVLFGLGIGLLIVASDLVADWAPQIPTLTSGVVKSASDCAVISEALKSSYNIDQTFLQSTDPKVKLGCDWKALKLDVQPPAIKPDPGAAIISVSPPRYAFWRMQAHVLVRLTVDDVGGGQYCTFQRSTKGWKQVGCKAA